MVLLTKAAGIEGAGSSPRARPGAPAGDARRPAAPGPGLPDDTPGISVVAEARTATRHGASAMHDPTEGGVRAAPCRELAHASARAPYGSTSIACRVRPETDRLCRHFGIDPLGLIGTRGPPGGHRRRAAYASLLRAWRRRSASSAT